MVDTTQFHLALQDLPSKATTRDVIEFARRFTPARFRAELLRAAALHLVYASKTFNAHSARIAGDCGRRCEQIEKAIASGAPLDLDDIRIRVEAFNIAAKSLDMTRSARNAIVNREAVAEIQGSSSE